ncbi:MAG: CehA/McbA family metallohydrolase [Deltaproteobacteria bacterium]|nr:CehA/McbA family metallohydrolase [Deltaproteobacteria bacterium]
MQHAQHAGMLGAGGTSGEARRSRRRGAAVAATLAAVLLASAARPDTFSFGGTFSPAQSGSYHDQQFLVPEGTAAVHVSYSYSSTGEAGALFANVVDIGIYDPLGLRGWSGSAKSSFSVALSAEKTTDGYVAGPMPAGPWLVEVGAAYVNAGSSTSWQVTVETEPGSGAPFAAPSWQEVTLGGAGWYAGDLHCHSTHSDGAQPPAQVFAYARQRGLDFIALTDHNAFTGHYEMHALQEQYDDILLVRGLELTSYRGHANVFGLTGYQDYHATEPGYDIGTVIDAIHEAGGLFSVNHPDLPGAEPAPGAKVSGGWTVEGTDWSQIDLIEVLNGGATLGGAVVNPFNAAAIEHWDKLLSEGRHVFAVGGSDDHLAGQGSTDESPSYAPIGTPTTVVYAAQWSEQGILAGLRAGRAYIRAESPLGPDLFVTADCGGPPATMGEEATGPWCRVTGRAVGGTGQRLVLVHDAQIAGEAVAQGDDFSHDFENLVPAKQSYVRLELRTEEGLLLALTNPVFLRSGPGPAWRARRRPGVPHEAGTGCSPQRPSCWPRPGAGAAPRGAATARCCSRARSVPRRRPPRSCPGRSSG